MNPNLIITFTTGDLNSGELQETRICSKVKHPITSELICDIERTLSRYLADDINLTLEDVYFHIELSTDNRYFFNHNDIFCAKMGNIHLYRMVNIINSLKRILL